MIVNFVPSGEFVVVSFFVNISLSVSRRSVC